jgi:hypothetical protein
VKDELRAGCPLLPFIGTLSGPALKADVRCQVGIVLQDLRYPLGQIPDNEFFHLFWLHAEPANLIVQIVGSKNPVQKFMEQNF